MRFLKELIICLILAGAASQVLANDDLYSHLLEANLPGASWQAHRTNYGIHYSSAETTRNSKGEKISSVTLDIEGPAAVSPELDIKDVLTSNIDNILKTTAINEKFQPAYPVRKGMGATVVNINGENVGFIEYEVPSNKMIYVRHGLILKNGKLYTLTMLFFDPKADRKMGMAMETLMIAAINSGKL